MENNHLIIKWLQCYWSEKVLKTMTFIGPSYKKWWFFMWNKIWQIMRDLLSSELIYETRRLLRGVFLLIKTYFSYRLFSLSMTFNLLITFKFEIVFLSKVQNFVRARQKSFYLLFDTVSVFWRMTPDTLISSTQEKITRSSDIQIPIIQNFDFVKKISTINMNITGKLMAT